MVGGAVVNFDGLYISWSDPLLDCTQRYMKTILDVIQNFKFCRMPFCTQVHIHNFNFFGNFFDTLGL